MWVLHTHSRIYLGFPVYIVYLLFVSVQDIGVACRRWLFVERITRRPQTTATGNW